MGQVWPVRVLKRSPQNSLCVCPDGFRKGVPEDYGRELPVHPKRARGADNESRSFAGVAIGTASPAMADPASQPVPNMTNNAVLGQPCNTTTGRFIFGYDASGKVLACGGSGRPGIWVDPGTLIGVRQIGSKCVAEIHTLAPDNTGLFTAQSPDGVALFCAYPTDTWEPRPYR
jgi:hypothetical protein